MTYELEGPDIYRGMNPAFVRRVWAERRARAGNKPFPQKKWNDEKKAQLLAYINQGLSLGQIGVKFGESREAIAGAVRYDPVLRKAMAERKSR